MGVPRLNSSVGYCSNCSVVISIVHEQEVRGLVLELAWGPQQRNKGTKRPQSKFRESYRASYLSKGILRAGSQQNKGKWARTSPSPSYQFPWKTEAEELATACR